MIKKASVVDWIRSKLPLVSAGCVLSFAATAETIVEGDLEKCRALEDQVARLACYDEVANRKPAARPEKPTDLEVDAAVEPASSAPDTPSPAAVEVAAPPPAAGDPLDTLGEEQLGEREQSEKLEVQARVVSCKKDDFRRYFFYFENGQVWKQKSDRRLSYKDCDFNITITKDFFGYKMLPEGETRRIRISRVR